MTINSNHVAVDGRIYRVGVQSIRRNFTVLDKYFERTEDGMAQREPLGTYNYTVKFGWSVDYPDDYDSLYELISGPDEKHSITIPYGKSGTLTYDAYISKGSDDLMLFDEDRNLWTGLSVDFVAMAPQRK